jgi:hypothetical protein
MGVQVTQIADDGGVIVPLVARAVGRYSGESLGQFNARKPAGSLFSGDPRPALSTEIRRCVPARLGGVSVAEFPRSKTPTSPPLFFSLGCGGGQLILKDHNNA